MHVAPDVEPPALATTPSPDASPDSGEAFRRGQEEMRARAATVCDERGKEEQEGYGLNRAAQNYYRARDAVRGLPILARPSPSPAIVKEAGEVEVDAEDNARADAWADFRDQHLEDGNDGYIAAQMYERARVAFDEGWAGGRAPAFSHARAALSASNAAQVSK